MGSIESVVGGTLDTDTQAIAQWEGGVTLRRMREVDIGDLQRAANNEKVGDLMLHHRHC